MTHKHALNMLMKTSVFYLNVWSHRIKLIHEQLNHSWVICFDSSVLLNCFIIIILTLSCLYVLLEERVFLMLITTWWDTIIWTWKNCLDHLESLCNTISCMLGDYLDAKIAKFYTLSQLLFSYFESSYIVNTNLYLVKSSNVITFHHLFNKTKYGNEIL